MPMVKALVSNKFNLKRWGVEWPIWQACRQIIPAALSCPEVSLGPGCIIFRLTEVDPAFLDGFDLVVDIEADYNETRAANLDQISGDVLSALHEVLNPLSTRDQLTPAIAVYLKLMQASWSSNASETAFDGDTSMEAAIARAWDVVNPGRP